MQGAFFDSWNATLPSMQAIFGEDWTLERTSVTWPAIAIDREEATSKVASGGKYIDTHTTIFVDEATFTDSGVKKGDIVVARTDRFTVSEIDKDGDAARTLLCSPVSVDWSLK